MSCFHIKGYIPIHLWDSVCETWLLLGLDLSATCIKPKSEFCLVKPKALQLNCGRGGHKWQLDCGTLYNTPVEPVEIPSHKVSSLRNAAGSISSLLTLANTYHKLAAIPTQSDAVVAKSVCAELRNRFIVNHVWLVVEPRLHVGMEEGILPPKSPSPFVLVRRPQWPTGDERIKHPDPTTNFPAMWAQPQYFHDAGKFLISPNHFQV